MMSTIFCAWSSANWEEPSKSGVEVRVASHVRCTSRDARRARGFVGSDEEPGTVAMR